MNPLIKYIKSVCSATLSLLAGMKRTLHSLIHPKLILTQQYPENRETLYIPERFRATLRLIPDDEKGGFKCTACTLCQIACPNDSIVIKTKVIETEDGKTKKVLDIYEYNLGSCTFCGQCVDACNFSALELTNDFENSEYDKTKFIKILNKE